MAAMKGSTARAIVLAVLAATACAPRSVAPLKVLGRWHEVSQGETVDVVADRYGVDPEALAELNDLPRTGAIEGREEIFVPGAGDDPPGTGAPPPRPVAATASKPGADGGKIIGKCGAEGRPCFSWPVDGKVGSTYGPRGTKHHDGIDILAARGTEIRAADDGVVVYSGDDIKGYGNLVLVKHDGGIITVYAHNDRNVVKEGDTVKRGQKIGEVGDTGSATATHLHFEVRAGERPRDPLLYLPTKE